MAAPRPWSAEEDALLKDAVSRYGDEPGMWKSIAAHIPGRTNKACRKRWLHSLSPTVKKTPWTSDEDATLLRLYSSHSPPRWSLIAKCIPGRTDDACAKRYREALDPQLKRDEWTPDEDASLLALSIQLGSRWTQVGQVLRRSGLACRNRWRLLQRKKDPPEFNRDNSPIPPSTPTLFINPLPPDSISTTSSLSNALSSPATPSDLPCPISYQPHKKTKARPRLSSHLPATLDRSVLPYACADDQCWSTATGRFSTASQLAEHRRVVHPTETDAKLYRCALEGCGKSWKNINGIQYHLQISRAHFKAALRARTEVSTDKRKDHVCPKEGCMNTYKQRTGLVYHLAHGHPENFAQLEVIPPGVIERVD